MKFNEILTKKSVTEAAQKLNVKIDSRHWSRYDHKQNKLVSMCAITAYIKANHKNTIFEPDSAEPGDDEYSCKKAAEILNLTQDEVTGFVIGFDGGKLREEDIPMHLRFTDWFRNTGNETKYGGWLLEQKLRQELDLK